MEPVAGPRVRAGTEDIQELLAHWGVAYECCEHPAAFTCEEADRLIPELPGPHNRNLFLRDFKGRQHYLLVMRSADHADLKALAKMLNAKSLSLASAERLERYLATPVGAVSLLSLANDRTQEVTVIVDRRFWACSHILCHPLRHDRTLIFSRVEMEKFLFHTGHLVHVMDIPEPAGFLDKK